MPRVYGFRGGGGMMDKKFIDNPVEAYERLKAENEKLQEKLSGKRFICKDCMAFAKKIEQYKQTLQEIREYAESISNEEMINGYAIRAKSALWRIANKITKAEEE
jgi:hypothetical protein